MRNLRSEGFLESIFPKSCFPKNLTPVFLCDRRGGGELKPFQSNQLRCTFHPALSVRHPFYLSSSLNVNLFWFQKQPLQIRTGLCSKRILQAEVRLPTQLIIFPEPRAAKRRPENSNFPHAVCKRATRLKAATEYNINTGHRLLTQAQLKR